VLGMKEMEADLKEEGKGIALRKEAEEGIALR